MTIRQPNWDLRYNRGGVGCYDEGQEPTPEEYGVGPIFIGGVQYYSDAAKLIKPPGVGNNRVAIMGDSFDTRSQESSGTFNAYGIWQLTNMLMDQRMDFVNIDAVGGSGAIQSPSYISRVKSGIYAFNPDWCAVRASINDIVNVSNTLSDIIAAYSALFADINSNGIKIITNTVAPSDTFTTAALAGNG